MKTYKVIIMSETVTEYRVTANSQEEAEEIADMEEDGAEVIRCENLSRYVETTELTKE